MSTPDTTPAPRKRKHHKFAFDWDASGFFPWRIPLFMILFTALAFFVCSKIDIDFPSLKRQEKRTSSLLMLNRYQLSGIMDDPRLVPLVNKGPVWADPVSSGIEGEMYFPLSAGLKAETEMATVELDSSLRGVGSIFGHMMLPEANVDAWLSESFLNDIKIRVSPLYAPRDAQLEGGEPLADTLYLEDLRGSRTTVWVDVNERGAPVSVLVTDSSGDGRVDGYAVQAVRQLRWLPRAGGRTGSIDVDWEGAVVE